MSKERVEEYVAAWVKHVDAGSDPDGQANLQQLLSLMSDDVQYEDVPTGHKFEGHKGVAEMCAFVSDQYDVSLSATSIQTDGERFAIEFNSKMKFGDKSVDSRGVALGTIGADGKITSHRDYYDAAPMAAAAAGS